METFAQVPDQDCIQQLLEEEGDEFPGRADAFRRNLTTRPTFDVFAAGFRMTFPRDAHSEAR